MAAHATTDQLPELNAQDLAVLILALESHERVHIERTGNPDAPPAIAARKVRAKVRILLDAARGPRRRARPRP
jgi:hypothetical protein